MQWLRKNNFKGHTRVNLQPRTCDIGVVTSRNRCRGEIGKSSRIPDRLYDFG